MASGPIEDTQWQRCAGCQVLLYRRRLDRSHGVCPECGHHLRRSAGDRVIDLVDANSFDEQPLNSPAEPDWLGFSDSRRYLDRLHAARSRTGRFDAAFYGSARIGGNPVVLAVLDFAFIGGSMGVAVGTVICEAARLALRERWPLVIVSASGGARMQEGALSLMQMARTNQLLVRLRDAGVLTVCIATDPTFGGTTASFVTACDVLIAEPGARIGFAGPEVIKRTIAEQLPDGFQSAERLLELGMIDLVEPRERLRSTLSRLLRLFRGRPVATAVGGTRRTFAEPAATDAWQTVELARHPARPTGLDWIEQIFDDFLELHGDRLSGDDPAIVGGPALLAGRPVLVIASQKGHDTRSLIARNFGMGSPGGYRKAIRLLRLAERLGLPVITLVDTPGAFPGVDSEDRGQAWAISDSIATLSSLRTPVLAVLTGEGGSGGALALAVGDRVFALRNTVYSVISPEGCSIILYGDTGHAAELAERLRVTAGQLRQDGIVDELIPEPGGGAHVDPAATAALVRDRLVETLGHLCGQPIDTVLAVRFCRFAGFDGEPVRVLDELHEAEANAR